MAGMLDIRATNAVINMNRLASQKILRTSAGSYDYE